MGLKDRIQHAWSAFNERDEWRYDYPAEHLGTSSGYRPDRPRPRRHNEQSIITAIYNRIAIDVSSITIQHIRQDPVSGLFIEDIHSGLNEAIRVSANIDQIGRAFIQDVVMSMFDEGCSSIVPTVTDKNPIYSNTFGIEELRVGKVIEWFPEHVRLDLYNQKRGMHDQIVLPKKMVAIVENPFYAVMNSPSSTLQRLIRKLNILDAIDEQSGNGKLDIIIQLPHALRTPQRIAQAEERRKTIEMQLAGSKYGIGYIDSTEHVTQLNRPAENNLMAQIQYLTQQLYNQLGLTEAIFNGTAGEEERANYYDGTIEPIVQAITMEMTRKFLTKTARTQGQIVTYFKEPFKLIPMSELAEIADKFIRNEILTANEFRSVVGYKPSNDPRADELRNPNIAASKDQLSPLPPGQEEVENTGNPFLEPAAEEI